MKNKTELVVTFVFVTFFLLFFFFNCFSTGGTSHFSTVTLVRILRSFHPNFQFSITFKIKRPVF